MNTVVTPFVVALAAGTAYIVCIATYLYAWIHLM